MTKAQAKKAAYQHVADLIRTTDPGTIWDDSWDDMSEDEQRRCENALEEVAQQLDRRAAR